MWNGAALAASAEIILCESLIDAANHHFLTPEDGGHFQFSAGRYRLQVFAKLLGDHTQTLLFTQELELAADLAAKLDERGAGVYFDWGADSSRYMAHVETKSPAPDPKDFLEALGLPANPRPEPAWR